MCVFKLTLDLVDSWVWEAIHARAFLLVKIELLVWATIILLKWVV